MYGNVYYAIQEADQIIKSTIAEVTVDNETSNQESPTGWSSKNREPLCNICEAANLLILHSCTNFRRLPKFVISRKEEKNELQEHESEEKEEINFQQGSVSNLVTEAFRNRKSPQFNPKSSTTEALLNEAESNEETDVDDDEMETYQMVSKSIINSILSSKKVGL